MKFFSSKKIKNNIVFIGSRHQPNIDACNYIFKFAEKLPKFNFRIIGNIKNEFDEYPSNVKFYGEVSEEKKYEIYSQCFLALNPMVSGSGSNMKLTDYMKNGLLCLTTKFGLRGFDEFSDYFFIDEIENFPNLIIKISNIKETHIKSKLKHYTTLYNQIKTTSAENILQIPHMVKSKKTNFLFYDNKLIKTNTTGTERYISELYNEKEKIYKNTYIKGIQLRDIKINSDIRASIFHKTCQFFSFQELNEVIKFKKIIYTYHDLILFKNSHYFKDKYDFENFKLLFELSFKCSNKIIAVSNSSKEELTSLLDVDESRINVIYHGISRSKFHKLDINLNKNIFSKFKKKYKIPNNYFLAISTDYPHKNLYQLSLLADKMSKMNDFKKYKVVLVGNKFYHDKRNIYISNNIIDLGSVPDQDLNILYNFSSIFLNLSLDEGFGMTNLEAQHMNVPVICSNIKPFKELLSNSACFVDPKNNNEILDTCINLINNIDLYETIKKKGFLNSEKFSWEKCQKDTFKLISNLH